jgi:hypothetical protein
MQSAEQCPTPPQSSASTNGSSHTKASPSASCGPEPGPRDSSSHSSSNGPSPPTASAQRSASRPSQSSSWLTRSSTLSSLACPFFLIAGLAASPSHFCARPVFWLLQAGNIIDSLGFFIPAIYLPTYARSLGFSNVIGIIVVSLLISTSAIGAVTIGFLVDRLDVTTVILISSLGATASVFLP